MPDIIDRIDKILANLNRIGGVEACIVASREGCTSAVFCKKNSLQSPSLQCPLPCPELPGQLPQSLERAYQTEL